MDQTQIRKPLATFVERIKSKYHPQQIILFGSYAKGEAREGSDVDVLVISDHFSQTDPYQRFRELYKMSMDLDPEFHTYGYTSFELAKSKYLPTLQNALKTGISLS
jgi:predicted nucleotidyltransferase